MYKRLEAARDKRVPEDKGKLITMKGSKGMTEVNLHTFTEGSSKQNICLKFGEDKIRRDVQLSTNRMKLKKLVSCWPSLGLPQEADQYCTRSTSNIYIMPEASQADQHCTREYQRYFKHIRYYSSSRSSRSVLHQK